jgi:hypothetical protein
MKKTFTILGLLGLWLVSTPAFAQPHREDNSSYQVKTLQLQLKLIKKRFQQLQKQYELLQLGFTRRLQQCQIQALSCTRKQNQLLLQLSKARTNLASAQLSARRCQLALTRAKAPAQPPKQPDPPKTNNGGSWNIPAPSGTTGKEPAPTTPQPPSTGQEPTPRASAPAAPRTPVPSAPVAGVREVKYLKLTIKRLKLWPTKTSGRCWDPCLGKRFQLPARGKQPYSHYFKNDEFRRACTGTWAPDAYVVIKHGKYQTFTTDKKNNLCNPTYNVSKLFRLDTSAGIHIQVFDNDGAAGVQVKRDLMGEFRADRLPKALLNGGKVVLRQMGRVEELVLEASIVTRKVKVGCSGVYKVTLLQVDIHDTRENGKKWDKGIGKLQMPDMEGFVQLGSQQLTIPKQQDTASKKFTNLYMTASVKPGDALKVRILDRDRTWTAQIKHEVIGDTTIANACSVLKHRVIALKNFGRVKQVLLRIEKQN